LALELYNSVAPANNVKEVENYVPSFFISSSLSQPPPVEESAPEAGNSEAPLFYFKEIVEEPDNYKPLPPAESPAPPAESAPEPNPPAEEQGPSESEPTPSPVYYKYPDSSSNSDDSAPVAESQEPKQEDGEELAGFPTQNFINQDNFKIPEFFRTFLNTPPKWINMNNW